MRVAILLLFTSITAFSQNNQDLRFIQNKGQWNEGIDFQAQVPGGRVGVSAKGFSVLLVDMEASERQHLAGHNGINESDGLPATEPIAAHYFQINFLGSNHQSKPMAGMPLDGYTNHCRGNN